jgi:transposase InsO family protein
MVHTDWHHAKNGKYLCTILDDASRKIIAAGEFDNEATKNALMVLKKARRECRKGYPIHLILTDHGYSFMLINGMRKGLLSMNMSSTSRYHIRHILCRVNHPQTNGKLEKFHDLYINHEAGLAVWRRLLLVQCRPHGALNLWEGEPPNMAFVRKLWPEVC